MTKSKVTLRAQEKDIVVPVTDDEKPEIHAEFVEKWQRLLDLLSRVLKVPTGLIMRITEENMEVFLKNSNRINPYRVGGKEHLGSGLYCETVIGTDDELIIENALASEVWKENPDVLVDMISYFGLPIKWPDGEFYGTLCVLDDNANAYAEDSKFIMREFRKCIEKDLEIMCLNRELKFYSEIDGLTGIYNRRYCDKTMRLEFERCKRQGKVYSVAVFDLDRFKSINDTLGHIVGDKVLKAFARTIQNRIRSIDIIGRYGGDEFLLICPDTDANGIATLIKSLEADVLDEMKTIVSFAGFSYGISSLEKLDRNFEGVVKRADERMYEQKKAKR